MTGTRLRAIVGITVSCLALSAGARAAVVINEVRFRPAGAASWPQVTSAASTLSLPTNAQGGPGANIQVPISAAPADGIYSIDTTIDYDPAVLQAVSVTTSGLGTTAGFSTFANLSTPGQILLSTYANSNPLSGSGEFARIQFHLIGTPGTASSLTFQGADINENGIVPAFASGLVTVTCSGAPNGTACTDANGCTVNDTCQSGVCTPGSTIMPPAELTGVTIAADKSAISWNAASGTGTVYDVARGLVGQWPAGGGQAEICAASGTSATTISDPTTPTPQTSFWYLSRARNSCGTGTYGYAEIQGVPATQRNPNACP